MKRALCLIPLLTALAFTACKPNVNTLLPISTSGLGLSGYLVDENGAEQAFRREAEQVVEHYITSGDARYASPTYGITLLHLAAMQHRLALVNQLLAEGADPNAVMTVPEYSADGKYTPEACATPIVAATRLSTEHRGEDAVYIVQALMRAGADLNYRDAKGRGVLAFLGRMRGWQEAGIQILELGAQVQHQDILLLSENGCYRVLEKILNSPAGERWRAEPMLLHDLASHMYSYDEGHRKAYPHVCACMDIILKHAPDLNARSPKTGATPLAAATVHLLTLDENDHIYSVSPYADFLKALIEGGADPYTPRSGKDFSTPADHLVLYGKHLVTPIYLNEQGQDARNLLDYAFSDDYQRVRISEAKPAGFGLEAPAHRFNEATLDAELHMLPMEAVRDEEVRAHWEALASAVTAPRSAKIDRRDQLATKALKLMQRADAARLTETITSRPCWKDAAAWQQKDGECTRWLKAVSEMKGLTLPAPWLVETAQAALAAGKPARARLLVRLMERCPAEETASLLDELCAESTPLALRAPACSVKLCREGLPALGFSKRAINRWWDEKNEGYKYDMPHSLRTAREAELASTRPTLLTDEWPMEESWDGRYEAEEDDLRSVGALQAAELYDAKDNRKHKATDAEIIEALLELEYQLAAYIRRHSHEILNPKENGYAEGSEHSLLDLIF